MVRRIRGLDPELAVHAALWGGLLALSGGMALSTALPAKGELTSVAALDGIVLGTEISESKFHEIHAVNTRGETLRVSLVEGDKVLETNEVPPGEHHYAFKSKATMPKVVAKVERPEGDGWAALATVPLNGGDPEMLATANQGAGDVPILDRLKALSAKQGARENYQSPTPPPPRIKGFGTTS